MDRFFDLVESKRRGMGSVSIFKDGKEVYQKTYGYANLKDSTLANQETKYRIGSISKTFTAAIIMQLIDEKKIKLETKLADYFPSLSNSEKITIEHLLRHQSGLYNFTSSKDFLNWHFQPKTKTELVELFIKNGSVFQPGEKTEYSNTGYVLLSFIGEKIENKEFSQILKERITGPLELKNTFYGGRIIPENNEAYSYVRSTAWVQSPETNLSIVVGAGALTSTPSDVNRFYNSLFSGKVVSENSLKEMLRYDEKNFGIGLGQLLLQDKVGYGHDGAIDGFQSSVVYFPKEKVSIALTSNGHLMPMKETMEGIISIYFGRNFNMPVFEEIKLSNEELASYTGNYYCSKLNQKVFIFIKDNNLIGQAEGQPPLLLEPYEKHQFKNEQAMIKVTFIPEKNKMILDQAGNKFEYIKE
ncbi:MAG TPA: serine hydrolase domain-containing protein [Cytophagales bacterium]|nr:serine hydrolase domain-containing protein [Cytophagales bacterium]